MTLFQHAQPRSKLKVYFLCLIYAHRGRKISPKKCNKQDYKLKICNFHTSLEENKKFAQSFAFQLHTSDYIWVLSIFVALLIDLMMFYMDESFLNFAQELICMIHYQRVNNIIQNVYVHIKFVVYHAIIGS